ncbi:MAG TPA: hypothetical protein VJL58_08805 [Pyrinomonadaceae bacterium]|nr:hypothetical protein [Pyrinomonadaceae bacterium]
MERVFQIAAAIIALVAAYFLWIGNSERAFVAGVLGAVCFFLSVRFQVKARNEAREQEKAEPRA